jgi:CcmD family protein
VAGPARRNSPLSIFVNTNDRKDAKTQRREEGVDDMNTMNYLFAAYVAVWLILAVYLYSIHSREKKLRQDVQRLKETLGKR